MWLEQKRAETGLSVTPIELKESQEWHMTEGSIRHHTGGFFDIAGLQTHSSLKHLDGVQQPILHQPEVGILGLIVASGQRETNWLLQAKPEPGNVHDVQLAPTVQATFSNYSRIHGGSATHYLDFFTSSSICFESNTLQSEQGTRFYQKFNRNAVCMVPFPIACPSNNFCWHTAGLVKELLLKDYSLNTDVRSVIATAPWLLLASHPVPFGGERAKAWLALETSYSSAPRPNLAKHIMQRLHGMRRATALRTMHVDLDGLRGWTWADNSIACCTGDAFEIGFYNIKAPTREKTAWDQPLLRSKGKDRVVLLAQRQGGIVRFLLRFSFEVGLAGGVELGPSYKRESRVPAPAWVREAIEQKHGRLRAAIEQSDEGGRFMKSRCQYSIIELSEDFPLEHDEISFWVTLAELESLTRIPKLLTNEARTVISMLLAFS